MFRRWLSTHKSLAVTALSGSLVAILVTTAAIVSGGYTAQRLDLGDAAVWVANTASKYIGRANTEILQLDSAIAVDGSDTTVVQQGSTVVAVDRADAKADVIDVATSEIEKTVPLPPDQPSLYLAGENIVVYSQGTGELWVLPFSSFTTFDAEQEPTLNLGADTVVSVADDGELFAYSSETAQVRRVDAAGTGMVEATAASTIDMTTGEPTIASVGGHWAVLNASTGQIEVDGTVTDLSGIAGTGSRLVLQKASSAGDGVLVGYDGGLLSVPFSGSDVSQPSTGQDGIAAAPTVLDGCVFAAWADGSAYRRCAGDPAEGVAETLDSVPGAARLTFQANGARLVLNDATSGATWAVQRGGELINNWDDLMDVDENVSPVDDPDETDETVVEKDQKPPVAVDDEFGARPGRATAMRVLLNDYDPNGDVLVIDSVTEIPASTGRIDLINERQELQVTLDDDASGEIAFDYTISDGRGGTATATVTLSVRNDDENSAPRQVRTTRATIEAGGQESTQVLGDWVDPDGDPFYLTSASVALPDSVSSGPQGTVVFSAGESSLGDVTVQLVVSDGTDEGSGSLEATVTAAGKAPLVADPFVVIAYAGQEVTVSPLDHVRGGTGTIALNAVPPRSGVTITPSYETGTFRFVSEAPRTHYIDYVITDDVSTVTGTVRIDVQAAPDVNSTPITIPKTVFVYTLRSSTVNVASTDIDPAGGVLLVTGTSGIPAGSGVQAEILNQESVRVQLTRLLDAPVTFEYVVTNGLAEATGTITVTEIPLPNPVQPPVARDDTATARVGDAIVIDVLANDDQPDGLEISLDPELVQELPADSGLLFVSAGALRYLAPDHPGNFSAVYQISGPSNQTAQAQVRIEVREANLETNNAPVPETVTARVLAGQTVRVDIPLTGIDPDGDSVQLLGQDTSPEKGAVSEVGSNYIDYEAGEYSAGTDTFTYAVVDALGARATGTVRIGISAVIPGARNPVATADEVVARPGASVSVQVLFNDSDPNGSPLTVTAAEPGDSATTVSIEDGSIVTITPPAVEGEYGVVYTIENESGGTSSNFITVTVSDEAPLAYPVATDTVLTLADIAGRQSIDVDVLQNVFFADGGSRELGLSVLEGFSDSATVTVDKHVLVTVADSSQIIPFAVSHPADPTIVSYAFIWVPGTNEAIPQLNRDAPALVVESEDQLRIDINDYVIAVGGKSVRLADSNSVQATHADGASLVVDDDTLVFQSAAHYSGPASISFEATDGESADDPRGNSATFVLPITVTQRDNQPPVFTGAVIEFEPGQEKTISLLKLTNYPHPEDVEDLVYSVIDPLPTGFSYELSGQTLTIRADADATVGAETALTLGVRDAVQEGQSGRIALSVVSSTRPLVRPATDVALVERGQTTVVDVLDNDQATNPFPGEPLSVVSISGLDGASLPAGVSVSPSRDDSELTVTVASDAEPTDTNIQYQVADATGDPARYAYGTVRISVQDVPDAPVAPVKQADQFVGGELKLRISPPQQNNSPITGYTIVSSSHGDFSWDCGTELICSVEGLDVGEDYRFSAIATNDIGDSEPSPLSDVYTVDYRPAAPTSVTAVPSTASAAPTGKSITVSWPNVPNPNPGSPIVGYTVLINGPGVSYTSAATSPFTTTAGGALSNDVSYSVTVYARNSAQVLSDADWRRTTTMVRTVGPPSVPKSGPKAGINADSASGAITVSWGDSSPNGANGVTYSVGRVTGSASAPTCSTGPGKPFTDAGPNGVLSGWVDTTAADGATYTYIVYADNGIYCTAAATGPVESKRPSGKATGTVSAVYRSSGQYDLQVNSDLAASGIVSRFEYRLGGSSTWQPVSAGTWLTSSADSSHYGVPTSVVFRACRDATNEYCGTESQASIATPLDVRAGVSSCIADDVSVPIVTAPRNVGDVAVTYTLAYNRPLVAVDPLDPLIYNWSDYTYSDADPVPSDAIGVRIKAIVRIGDTDYTDDSGYGETTCAP